MKKTIVIGNSIIVYAVDNGADRGVCGGDDHRLLRRRSYMEP